MHTPHVRHQFHLFSQKIILLLVLLLAFEGAQAQQQKRNKRKIYNPNQSGYDDRDLHYGFFVAGHGSRFLSRYSRSFVNGTDSAYAVNPRGSAGFGLGAMISYRLGDYFDLRVTPAFAHYERSVEYRFTGGTVSDQIVESNWIELPISLKYKSKRRGNIRMYVLGGVKPAVEVGSSQQQNTEDVLRTQSFDFAVEYGMGFDLYFPFFKFSPELRFSHGLPDLLVVDRSPYSTPLERLRSHSVSVYLFF